MAYPNIPKVSTSIVDGNLRVSPETSLEPKVILLGITSSTVVPLQEPVPINGDVRVSDFDNSDGTVSELSMAIQEALDGGAKNLEAFVIAQKASYTNVDDRVTDLQTAYDLLLNHDMDIIVPVGAHIDAKASNGSTLLEFGYQLADFCYRASSNFNSVIGVMGTSPVSSNDSITLSELNAWVTALDSFDTSTINGWDFTYFDGVTDGGSDGVPDNYKFWATTDSTPDVASGANVIKDDNSNPVDIGAYISVVAGQYLFKNAVAKKKNPSTGAYSRSGEAVYAGFIASLPPWSGTTNKVIPGVSVIRNLSLAQADKLTKDRFVVFVQKPKGVTVVSGVTGAYHIDDTYKSDFTRLTTVRVVQDAVERVRFVADPFIGEPNNSVNRSALVSEIQQTLGRLQQVGALRRFDFALRSTPDMQVLGQIDVELVLVPAFEITEIAVRVGLGRE